MYCLPTFNTANVTQRWAWRSWEKDGHPTGVGVFHLYKYTALRGSVTAVVSPGPQSSLQSVNFWKSMKEIFCYLISFLKVTLVFCGLSRVFHRNKELLGSQSSLLRHWWRWADSGSHYPVLSQKILWVI